MKMRFKRVTALLLTLAMTFSLLSVGAFAKDAPEYAHLEIGSAEGKPGDTVKVPVYLKGLKDGQKCRGFGGTVVLGKNLTLEGAEWTELVAGFSQKSCNTGSGYLTAMDMDMSGANNLIAENGQVCNLLVKIADDATSVGTVSFTGIKIVGEGSKRPYLNSTDGTVGTLDGEAVIVPTDEDGNDLPVISIKGTDPGPTDPAAGYKIVVSADKASVTAGEDVTVTVAVEGGNFQAAKATLSYDSGKFDVKSDPALWTSTGSGYTYFNVDLAGLNATLGTFVFTAKAQTEEVTGSFTLSATGCGKDVNDAAEGGTFDCANNGKVDVTIALKTDLAVTAENKTVTYDGSAQAFNAVTCDVAGADIAYGETEGAYDLTAVPSKTDANTYTLYYQVTAPGYAPKTGSYTLTIEPADIEASLTGFDGLYDGDAHTVGVAVTKPTSGYTVTYSETEDGTYTSDAPSRTDVGTTTVWVKIDAGSNYKVWKGSAAITVTEAEITFVIEPVTGVTYDGQLHASATVTSKLPEGATVTYKWTANGVEDSSTDVIPKFAQAGTYHVSYEVTYPNYAKKTGSYDFTIANAAITGYVIAAKPDVNYTGEAQESATLTRGTPADAEIVFTCNGQTYYGVPSFTGVGSYEVSYVISAENYNDVTGSYTFTIKDGTIEASSTGYNGAYDGNARAITVTVAKPEGTTTYYRTSEDGSTDAGAWSTTNPTFTDVGTYTVYWKVEKAGYATVSGSDTVSITPGTYTGVSYVGKPLLTYDGDAYPSGMLSGKLPEGAQVTFKWTDENGGEQTSNEIPKFANAGTYTVSYTITSANYSDITGSYTFEIGKLRLSMDDSVQPVTVTYDGQPHSIDFKLPTKTQEVLAKLGLTVKATYTLKSKNDVDVNETITAPTYTDAGKYLIQVDYSLDVTEPNSNFTSGNGIRWLTIDPKDVTITVDNQTKTLGDADPVFSYTVDGVYATGDLGEITCTRKPGETVGEYEIDASYTANPNYSVTVHKGTLTIGAPEYVTEITEEYVAGYKLVLVYTNSNAAFTYDTAAMYDVTAAGYKYKNTTEYRHVFGLAVADADADAGKVAAGTGAFETLPYGYDVNGNNTVADLDDAMVVVAVYNVRAAYVPAKMKMVLQADVNGDKLVNVLDFGTIRAEYLKK